MSDAETVGNLKRPLRVLFAVDSLFPGFGGAEKQALTLANALRERGAYVEFVAPQIRAEESLHETIHGFIVKRIAYPKINKLGALVLIARFNRYLVENAHRFDAVHVHITHLLAAAAGFARRRSQLRVITKISGFYEFEGGVLDQSRCFNPVNVLIRRGLRHVDYVQTISVQTHLKLLGAGFTSSQIKFVPNGIDIRQEPVPSPTGDTLRIGFCGRLREVKGVHILLAALAIIKKVKPEKSIKISIAGDGEQSESLHTQTQMLGLVDSVEWLGRIEDTRTFLQSLDIYVQPSFAEGLPNSVMEAMLEQRPVIATDVGGNSDLIEDSVTGLLFPAGDSAALSECIMRLMDEPDLRLSIARSARKIIVEGYGFDYVVAQLEELYRV